MIYSDWDDFDPQEFVSRCYADRICRADQLVIKNMQRAIDELGLRPGSLRLGADVGAGPNLFPALIMAPFIAPKEKGGRIDLIDPSQPNRQYLQNVLDDNGGQTALTGIWNKFEAFMADYSTVWRNALPKAKTLARVIDGDIYNLPENTYDIITSYTVTESITDNREECERAIQAQISAAKPGGVVAIGHMLKSTGWHAGIDTSFPAVPLTVEDIQDIYKDKLDNLTIIPAPFEGELRPGDHGVVGVIGTKPLQGRAQPSSAPQSFTYYDTQSCLYDQQRVEHLNHAIYSTVKPGDVVVDGGSGTGVLGMLAVRAGAAKVYCVEMNEESAQILRNNARINGMQDKIEVIVGDATTIDLPEYVDVIVAEVISCGFFYEPQIQIVNNLKRFLKHGGTIIPELITHDVELIDAQEELYGLQINYDARYYPLHDTTLTTRGQYLTTDFYKPLPTQIDGQATVRCRLPGRANALKVTYAIQFSQSTIATEPTEFLLIPQIIFLPDPIQLELGQRYNVRLRYTASSSPLECNIAVTKC